MKHSSLLGADQTLYVAAVQAVTGCLVWALDRTTFRHTILEAGQQRRQKYEVFLTNVSLWVPFHWPVYADDASAMMPVCPRLVRVRLAGMS